MTDNQENKTVDSFVSADEKSVKFDRSLLGLIRGADVEWKTLGEVTQIFTGGDAKGNINKGQKEATEDFPYAIYSNGTETYGYSDVYRVDKHAVTVSSIGNVGFVAYREPYFTPIIRLKVFIPKNESSLDTKFLYHFMSTMTFTGTNSSLSSMKVADFTKLQIPIPSIEIQEKVVEILDKMTDYVMELTAELTAELTLRQKQYAYYRDQLLTFPSQSDSDESLCVEWRALGEISEIKRGKRLVKNDLEEVGEYPVYQNSMTPMGYYHKYNFEGDNTFIICAGAAGEIGYMSENFWAADDVSVLTVSSNLMSRYLYHFLLTKQNSIKSKVRRASVPRLSKISFENIKIPVPALSEQKRIVEILDKFDKLTSDLSEGLPREIELRQKQYEYWREQLLSFK